MPNLKNSLLYEQWYAARIKHGGYRGGKEQPEHYIWRSMLIRCDECHEHYENVTVCERWRVYENFLVDMGYRPSPKHTLDRYPDPFGNYELENCRWTSWSEQQQNRRYCPQFMKDKMIGTSGAWAKVLGISAPLARWRWKNWGTFAKGEVWTCVPPKDLKKLRLKNTSIA